MLWPSVKPFNKIGRHFECVSRTKLINLAYTIKENRPANFDVGLGLIIIGPIKAFFMLCCLDHNLAKLYQGQGHSPKELKIEYMRYCHARFCGSASYTLSVVL